MQGLDLVAGINVEIMNDFLRWTTISSHKNDLSKVKAIISIFTTCISQKKSFLFNVVICTHLQQDYRDVHL